VATAPYRRPLTPRQLHILGYVRAHYALHGYPPTIRETAVQFGLSPSTIHGHLRLLVMHGDLEILYRGGRNYWPVERPRGTS
jgi:SOS-response transcriptional repressor LexA